jgi:predicted DNA-binding transcriptional regulator
MSKDQAVGALLVLVSIIVIVAYIWLAFFPYIPGVDIILLKLTGTVAIVVVFGILAWIGYTLATTPPPKPIEEIEKELEKELKETEKPKAEEAKPGAPEAKPEAPKA